MAGATIDHMISLTILIAALLVAMMTYNGLFASAVDYDRNRQVANKAIDIMNTICLSPGNPTDWGETNDTLLGFGLQDPEAGGYALSPYSLMRLRTSNSSGGSQIVYYPITGLYYNNLSDNYGNGVFTPLADCVNYTYAAELLGVNGTYGFSIDIAPTLDVNISQVSQNPLELVVEVHGSGLPLSGADLNYCLFYVDKIDDYDYPFIVPYSGVAQTNSSGSVTIPFSSINGNKLAYSFTVYVSLNGLTGVGHYTQNTIDSENQYIIPLIQDFDDGKIIIAHNWDDDTPAVHYNATFFILTSEFQMQQVEIANSTGLLNFGEGKPYNTTQIPASEAGMLVISYKKSAVEMGSVILPWGISTLGVSATFQSDTITSGYDFVATELRQVTIDGISYQVKVSAWSLNG
jgi:hypothetical protein